MCVINAVTNGNEEVDWVDWLTLLASKNNNGLKNCHATVCDSSVPWPDFFFQILIQIGVESRP